MYITRRWHLVMAPALIFERTGGGSLWQSFRRRWRTSPTKSTVPACLVLIVHGDSPGEEREWGSCRRPCSGAQLRGVAWRVLMFPDGSSEKEEGRDNSTQDYCLKHIAAVFWKAIFSFYLCVILEKRNAPRDGGAESLHSRSLTIYHQGAQQYMAAPTRSHPVHAILISSS